MDCLKLDGTPRFIPFADTLCARGGEVSSGGHPSSSDPSINRSFQEVGRSWRGNRKQGDPRSSRCTKFHSKSSLRARNPVRTKPSTDSVTFELLCIQEGSGRESLVVYLSIGNKGSSGDNKSRGSTLKGASPPRGKNLHQSVFPGGGEIVEGKPEAG